MQSIIDEGSKLLTSPDSRKIVLSVGAIALIFTVNKLSKLIKFLKAEPVGVEAYVSEQSDEEPPLLRELRHETWKETRKTPMLAGPMQGRFLKMLVNLTGAKRILEIGCFTGYSSLSMAEALPSDGKIITCDVSEKFTNIAKRYWARAGSVGERIELRLAPALETIKTLDGQFDLVFIDADKPNNLNYYNAVFPLVKHGGLIVIDNVLLFGTSSSAFWRSLSKEASATHACNEFVKADKRVEKVMLTVRDGVTLVRKK